MWSSLALAQPYVFIASDSDLPNAVVPPPAASAPSVSGYS